MVENEPKTTDRQPTRHHHLLAVKPSIKTQAAKCLADLSETFTKRRAHFRAHLKTYTPFVEDPQAGQRYTVEETSDIQTKVMDELSWLSPYLAKAYDITLAVSLGDAIARADLTLDDGTILAHDLPSTVLLDLEDRMVELLTFAKHIPTLDPALGFKPDPDKGEGVWVSREGEKYRTAAKKRVIELSAPTKEHKAQVQLIDEQVPVGIIKDIEWSSAITVSAKALILERLEELTRAIKLARTKANEVQITNRPKIGEALLSYVFTGTKPV